MLVAIILERMIALILEVLFRHKRKYDIIKA